MLILNISIGLAKRLLSDMYKRFLFKVDNKRNLQHNTFLDTSWLPNTSQGSNSSEPLETDSLQSFPAPRKCYHYDRPSRLIKFTLFLHNWSHDSRSNVSLVFEQNRVSSRIMKNKQRSSQTLQIRRPYTVCSLKSDGICSTKLSAVAECRRSSRN